MSLDGVSAVTVTRDEGKADAPGSSGNRNAEADGPDSGSMRGIMRRMRTSPTVPVTSTSLSTPEVNLHTNPPQGSK